MDASEFLKEAPSAGRGFSAAASGSSSESTPNVSRRARDSRPKQMQRICFSESTWVRAFCHVCTENANAVRLCDRFLLTTGFFACPRVCVGT